MILRIDDVSPSTDMDVLEDLLFEIKCALKPERIMLAVNILGKDNAEGSVYPKIPFKDRENDFFYKIDCMLDVDSIPGGSELEIASHGLLHMDHSKLNKQSQEMSILTSCSYLDCTTFVPPFNRYNHITESICFENRLRLIKPQEGWRSLDHHVQKLNTFDFNHKLWYLHPWRWTVDSFREKVSSKIGRFIPSGNGTGPQPVQAGGML